MLTGERRGSSARRGMQVLGKIPAVPKPINLPSQRLENRGLDPNVEIVPRGSVSWGSVGRSPPTSNSAWGNPPPASSPPVSSGAWGAKSGTAPAGTGAGVGGPANLPRPTSGGSGARPTSGGSGTRPSSAGSIGQSQQSPDSFSSTANSNSAWGARPASASGVLGQAQQTSVPLSRPRSADTSRSLSNLSQFGESANPSPPAWGSSGAPRRLGEEPHQVSRFQLTRTDFPTLGSEKNPDLRPQQGTSVPERGGSVEEKVPASEETWSHAPPGPHEEVLPTPPTENYGIQDRGAMDSWRREPAPFQGPPPIAEGNWHREGPPPRPLHGGQLSQADNWRRDAPPLGGPADDSWRRGGAPPVGQYGPPPGPGHFPHDGPGFMHQPRFGLGPAPYGRGVPGPGGYGHHGDMYNNAGPLLRPAGPMHPLRPNMYQGPGPYDGFYGPPNYQGMEESERMMLGMGGGPYGGYPQHRGPPPEAFGRYPHGGMIQGPRHPLNNNVRDRSDSVGEGYHEGPNFHKEGPGHKEGRGYSERFSGGPAPSQDTGDNRRGAAIQSANPGTDSHRQSHRGGSSGHHVGHRDWGASDEPMDFSKPVFEEEIPLPSSDTSGKQSPAPAQIEVTAVEEVKHEDTVKLDNKHDKNIVDLEVLKDEEQAKVIVGPKSETVASLKLEEDVSTPTIKINDAVEVPEGRDQIERKVLNVVDKEVVAKVVTKEMSGKWERGSRRAENNNNREVIGPAAASVHPSRSGQQKATKPGILGNAPRIATSEVAPSQEVSHPPSQDKFAAVPSPPASETESQKASEKPRNIRRSGVSGVDSPRIEPVVGDTGALNASGALTPAVPDSVGKDGTKAKAKASSHDGEKEWRPKVPLAESSPRPLVTAPAPVIKPVVAQATPVPTDSSDNTAPESESSLQPDPYDFDAQRAKMKEIAAQRARQLQKEEEERIKEQKAKARAKLEELDRRGRAHVSTTDETLVETLKTTHEDDVSTLEQPLPLDTEPVVDTGFSSSTSRGSGRNEHGKRERDRKANGRKAAVAVAMAESTKGKMNGTVAQPTAILPAPTVTAAPLLSTPVIQPELHGQQVKAQQLPRSHRNSRPEKKQIVARLDDADQVNFPMFADNGGWNIGASASQDTDLVDHVSQVSMSSTSRKKTSSKRSNRRTVKEIPQEGPISGEGIQFGDIIAELHTNGSSGSDIPVDPNLILLRADSGKDTTSLFNVNLSGDALTGDEESAVSTNGDVPTKRVQRKGHSARRPARGDRGSQDVRVADKSHSNDSMVWAPVRSPQAGGGSKADSVDTRTSEQPKEESSAVQQSAQAPVKRGELERYSPKPVLKHLEAVEARAPSSQRHTQTSLNTNTQAAPPSPANSAETIRVPEAKQSSSVDAKLNHDVKQVDPSSKRPHGAWRQRGSGNDRGSENVKDLSSSHPSGPASGDTGNQPARTDQKSGGHPPFRRNQGPGNQLLAALQATQITSPSNPGPTKGLPASTSTQVSVPDPSHAPEREQPAHQKPYQPPRPTSAPAQRGQDQQGQNPRFSKNKGHEQGSVQHSRNFGVPADGSFPSENPGPHQPNRTGGGNHPRQQVSEREQAPNQQVFAGPHSQNKSAAAPAHKEPGQPMPRERHHQHQQSSRGDYQQSDSNDHGSHPRGRFEGEHEMRPSGAPQRGQSHWQQTAAHDGYRAGSSRTHASERDLPISQSGRNEAKKQEAADSQGSQQSSGQHQSKAPQQTAPMAIPSPKVDSGHWTGEGGSPPVSRGRDFNHGRRGRFGGGRTGARNTEVEHRRDPPVTKQRLVIDATGGAVPSQVAG